jgi:LemA protein
MISYIVLAVFILLIIYFIILNNNLIAKKNRVDQATSSIEVYEKKRFDLIPNLVAVVKKYTEHEKDLLTEVTRLRESNNSTSKNYDVDPYDNVGKLLSQIQVNVENYPEIKADRQFINLQYSLNDIEEQLSAARRTYNAAVTDFNNGIEMFPMVLVAKLKGYQHRGLLKSSYKEHQNVNVSQMFS